MISRYSLFYLYIVSQFSYFQDESTAIKRDDIDAIVKAASIVQADEKNKNKADYMLAIFYEKSILAANERLPTDFTHKIVTATGYEAATAPAQLPRLVEEELKAQPRVENVIFIQDKNSNADISAAVLKAMSHERKVYVAFNITNDTDRNANIIKACDVNNPKVGVFDTRHNTSNFHCFKSACSFSVSQRVVSVASGESTIIVPTQANRGGGTKRRGGYNNRGGYGGYGGWKRARY